MVDEFWLDIQQSSEDGIHTHTVHPARSWHMAPQACADVRFNPLPSMARKSDSSDGLDSLRTRHSSGGGEGGEGDGEGVGGSTGTGGIGGEGEGGGDGR